MHLLNAKQRPLFSLLATLICLWTIVIYGHGKLLLLNDIFKCWLLCPLVGYCISNGYPFSFIKFASIDYLSIICDSQMSIIIMKTAYFWTKIEILLTCFKKNCVIFVHKGFVMELHSDGKWKRKLFKVETVWPVVASMLKCLWNSLTPTNEADAFVCTISVALKFPIIQTIDMQFVAFHWIFYRVSLNNSSSFWTSHLVNSNKFHMFCIFFIHFPVVLTVNSTSPIFFYFCYLFISIVAWKYAHKKQFPKSAT